MTGLRLLGLVVAVVLQLIVLVRAWNRAVGALQYNRWHGRLFQHTATLVCGHRTIMIGSSGWRGKS